MDQPIKCFYLEHPEHGGKGLLGSWLSATSLTLKSLLFRVWRQTPHNQSSIPDFHINWTIFLNVISENVLVTQTNGDTVNKESLVTKMAKSKSTK